MKKGGIIISKIEMTKLRHNDSFVAVTIAKLVPQQTVIRVKTIATDGYNAVVMGITHAKRSGEFAYITEFRVSDEVANEYTSKVGEILDLATAME